MGHDDRGEGGGWTPCGRLQGSILSIPQDRIMSPNQTCANPVVSIRVNNWYTDASCRQLLRQISSLVDEPGRTVQESSTMVIKAGPRAQTPSWTQSRPRNAELGDMVGEYFPVTSGTK